MTTRIIDFHTHLGISNSASYEEVGAKALGELVTSPSALLKKLDEAEIGLAVVFPPPMLSHTQREINYDLMGRVKGEPRFLRFAFLDPRLEESPGLLEELLSDGCKGLKLHPICHGYVVSHSLCYPTLEVARKFDVPVLIHSGWGEFGEIRFIARLAKQFPDLKIVVAHLVEFKDIFELLPGLENVYVETSYASHPRRIAQAVTCLGADRVIFGSDFPTSDPAFELFKVRHALISDGDRGKILYENASRLLKLA